MKKTVISLLLVLAMILCTVLVNAPVTKAADDFAHDDAPSSHEGWTALSTKLTNDSMTGGASSAFKIEAGGNYYLDSNITVPASVNVNRLLEIGTADEVTICLNGKTIDANGKTRILILNKANCKVNLCDCSAEETGTLCNGYVTTSNTSGRGGNIHANKGTLNVYSGNITGGVAAYEGGNIYVHTDVNLNLYGGTITDGSDAAGANIYFATTGKLNGKHNLDALDAYVAAKPGAVDGIVAMKSIVTTPDTYSLVKLYSNAAPTMDITSKLKQNAVIDLNGHTLGGTITNDTYKLSIADSSANVAGVGTGKITVDGFTSAGLAQGIYSPAGRYITLADTNSDWGYSVHRIYVGFDTIQLTKDDEDKIGMNYVTNFQMDNTVKALLVNGSNGYAAGCNFGVGSLDAAETRGYAKDDYKANISTNINAILGGETAAETAVAYDICAQSFINLQIGDDVVTITSNTYDYSLQDVIDALYDVENLEDQNAAAADLLADIKTLYGIEATPAA